MVILHVSLLFLDLSCHQPPCVENSMATLVDGQFPAFDSSSASAGTAKYLCQRGYAFPGENLTKTITCLRNDSAGYPAANWETNTEICERKYFHCKGVATNY